MNIYSNQPAAFITLIAHEPDVAIVSQLSAYFGNFIEITHTQEEAAAAFLDEKYKLFILDLKLVPAEFIAEIKAENKRLFDLPLLALSDEIDNTQRQTLIASGFDDCLTKPLTIAKVDETILLWLNQNLGESPLVSAHNLLSKFRYNRKLVATLYGKIFDQFPRKLEDIDRALTAADYQTAYNIVHALDSESRICYLNDISDTAKNLGLALKSKQHDAMLSAYKQLNKNIHFLIGQRELLTAFFDEM